VFFYVQLFEVRGDCSFCFDIADCILLYINKDKIIADYINRTKIIADGISLSINRTKISTDYVNRANMIADCISLYADFKIEILCTFD
jgi:hypothetical protein